MAYRPNYAITRYEIHNPVNYLGWLRGWLELLRLEMELDREQFGAFLKSSWSMPILAWRIGHINQDQLYVELAKVV